MTCRMLRRTVSRQLLLVTKVLGLEFEDYDVGGEQVQPDILIIVNDSICDAILEWYKGTRLLRGEQSIAAALSSSTSMKGTNP
jgi:hypothetical protein